MSLIRHSFSKTISEFAGAIATPKILGTSVLSLLLFVTIAAMTFFKILIFMYPILAKFLGIGVLVSVFLMPLIFIIQTIYTYKYMKERYNEDSEVKGSLGIKYIKIIIFGIGIFIIAMCISVLYSMAIVQLLGNWNAIKVLNFLMAIITLYIWSRIFVIPYAIIIDDERNSILKSLKMTKEYSGKIFFAIFLFGVMNYVLSTILSFIHFGNLLTIRMIIMFIFWVIMSIFMNIFYINMYQRLKEFQDEKIVKNN